MHLGLPPPWLFWLFLPRIWFNFCKQSAWCARGFGEKRGGGSFGFNFLLFLLIGKLGVSEAERLGGGGSFNGWLLKAASKPESKPPPRTKPPDHMHRCGVSQIYQISSAYLEDFGHFRTPSVASWQEEKPQVKLVTSFEQGGFKWR